MDKYAIYLRKSRADMEAEKLEGVRNVNPMEYK